MLYSHFETELRSQLIQINRKLKKKEEKKDLRAESNVLLFSLAHYYYTGEKQSL